MTSRIGIVGAGGRMGLAIARAVGDAGATLAGGIGRDGAVFGPYTDAKPLAAAADVLIDFSSPDALAETLAAARAAGTPIVVGTTGLTADHHMLVDAAAGEIAILQAANTSVGVHLLARLVEFAAARLGPEWDIEIAEMHHRDKRDAPSGTALLLGEAAARGRGAALADIARQDPAGVRPDGAIGFASLRGGSVAGDHLVILAGRGERIELGHRAESRAIFADGAVTAALWLVGRPAGRYGMADVLGS